MQRFRVDLKIFLGLAMPNQCCHAVRNKYLVDLYLGFFSKKPQTLVIPTIVLYDDEKI